MLGDFNGRRVAIQSEDGSTVSRVMNNLRYLELKELYARRHDHVLRSRREDAALKKLIDLVEPLMAEDAMLTFEEAIRLVAGQEPH